MKKPKAVDSKNDKPESNYYLEGLIPNLSNMNSVNTHQRYASVAKKRETNMDYIKQKGPAAPVNPKLFNDQQSRHQRRLKSNSMDMNARGNNMSQLNASTLQGSANFNKESLKSPNYFAAGNNTNNAPGYGIYN